MTSESQLRDADTDSSDRSTSTSLSPPSSDEHVIAEVREILVGPQLRALDKRFGRVEEMVLTHNSRLLKLLDRRIAVVEELVETRVASLQEAIDRQDRSMGDLETRLLDEGRALRAEFDALSAEMSHQLDQLRRHLDAETAALRQGAESHDRDLAQLFQDMASRLLKSSDNP